MWNHVGIRVSDRSESERFYRLVLAAIGIEETHTGQPCTEWGEFVLGQASADEPVTRNLHIGFNAPSRDAVDEFWRAGTESGYESDGEPGPRTVYAEDYYGSFLIDPDGNSAEAARHGDPHDGVIDHLWIGASDLREARAFYCELASAAGLRMGTDTAERVLFRGATGSFSLVADGRPLTENLHMSFPARPSREAGSHHDPDGNRVDLVG